MRSWLSLGWLHSTTVATGEKVSLEERTSLGASGTKVAVLTGLRVATDATIAKGGKVSLGNRVLPGARDSKATLATVGIEFQATVIVEDTAALGEHVSPCMSSANMFVVAAEFGVATDATMAAEDQNFVRGDRLVRFCWQNVFS